jgi:hypothetical protein
MVSNGPVGLNPSEWAMLQTCMGSLSVLIMSIRIIRQLLFGVFLLGLFSCGSVPHPEPSSAPLPPDPIANLLEGQGTLQRLGFSVQVGAFSRLENAVGLEQGLKKRGVDAYYFLHESGFYKVRFGDHPAYAAARSEAERLQAQGIIDNFFIVVPDDYPIAKIAADDKGRLRRELVSTAERFLGVPYRWGGEDKYNGFDCSGLTMVSYRLNGLKLPRNSRAQFQAGRSVAKRKLQPGDLVFFATKGGTRVTHVGMYIGEGRFIHAPRPGKTVRLASLSSRYFRKTYVGARTYL